MLLNLWHFTVLIIIILSFHYVECLLSRWYFYVRDIIHQIDTRHFPKGKLPGKCCGMVGGLKKKEEKEKGYSMGCKRMWYKEKAWFYVCEVEYNNCVTRDDT